jgi:hypothetical protein
VHGTLSTAAMALLAAGEHDIFVRGMDSGSSWGPVDSVVLNLDKAGPTVTGLSGNPNPTTGLLNVSIMGTASDVATGNGNVTAAEFFVGAVGANGSGTAMTMGGPASPVRIASGIALAPLGEGDRVISVHAQDALGNWGPFTELHVTADRTGPNTTGISILPAGPNNGTLTFDINTFAIKVSATVSDPLSGIPGVQTRITAAEGFIDVLGAAGSGFVFLPSDAAWTSPTEAVYDTIPLSGIQALSQGPHLIYVRGRDALGNWGPASSATLIIDKTGPAISGAAASPNPTNGATSVTLTGTATDPANGAAPASTVTAAEWFDGTDPGPGQGTPMTAVTGFNSPSEALTATINISAWANGTHNLGLRARDAAGNWGPVVRVLLNKQPADTLFATGFESGGLAAWNARSGAVQATTAAALVGQVGMRATITASGGGSVVDLTPVAATNYHARFVFHPRTATTGSSGHIIFIARDGSGRAITWLEFRNSGGTRQVRLVALAGGTNRVTAWQTISATKASTLELAWRAGTNASVLLYLNGTLKTGLYGLTTTSYRIESARLGASGALAAVRGVEDFDAFLSTRTTLIGP